MIGVKELRIGNLLYDEVTPKHQYQEVIAIDAHHKKISCFNNYLKKWCVGKIDSFKPIHLTEEWLLKFGFKNFALKKHKATFGFYRKKRFTIIWNKDKGFTAEGFKIKYVHQLQNLYYFTGEELTIKTDNNDTGN